MLDLFGNGPQGGNPQRRGGGGYQDEDYSQYIYDGWNTVSKAAGDVYNVPKPNLLLPSSLFSCPFCNGILNSMYRTWQRRQRRSIGTRSLSLPSRLQPRRGTLPLIILIRPSSSLVRSSLQSRSFILFF